MLTKPVSNALKLAFAGASGVFKGTFSRTISGKAVITPFEGVVLATQITLPNSGSLVRAAGFFSTGTGSGDVEIE